MLPTALKDRLAPLRPLGLALLQFLRVSVGAYGLSVTGGLLLRGLIGEVNSLMALYNTLAHLLWMGAAGLLLVTLLLRRWLLAALLLLPTLAFVAHDGLHLLSPPDPQPDPRQIAEFSVISYNLLGGRGDYSASIELLQQADADLIALQEVDADAAEQIDAALAPSYPYAALHPGTRVEGQAVYSRYPILDDVYWQSASTISGQRTVIEVAGNQIVLHNVHPPPPGIGNGLLNTASRSQSIGEVLAYAAPDRGPVLLVGDFNATDLTEDYARIAADYRDTFRQAGAGLGWTWPHWITRIVPHTPPLLRIDYVFQRGPLQTLDAGTWPSSGGSDHAPVWARLALVDYTLSVAPDEPE